MDQPTDSLPRGATAPIADAADRIGGRRDRPGATPPGRVRGTAARAPGSIGGATIRPGGFAGDAPDGAAVPRPPASEVRAKAPDRRAPRPGAIAQHGRI